MRIQRQSWSGTVFDHQSYLEIQRNQVVIVANVVSAVVAAASGCSWAHPGANPYRGDPVAVLADFAMPEETRRQLRTEMAAYRYTDIAIITRDDIVGRERYGDLREMHSGRGQTCRGAVDRSAWKSEWKELGIVYCVGETCVLVPTVCNNVSLVTRMTDKKGPAAGGDDPLDFSPAAGLLSPLGAPLDAIGGNGPADLSPAAGLVSLLGAPIDVIDGDGPIDLSPAAGPLSPLGEPPMEEDWTQPYSNFFPPYWGGGGGPANILVLPVSLVPETPISSLIFTGLALMLAGAQIKKFGAKPFGRALSNS
jgi:hypothetical protein